MGNGVRGVSKNGGIGEPVGEEPAIGVIAPGGGPSVAAGDDRGGRVLGVIERRGSKVSGGGEDWLVS